MDNNNVIKRFIQKAKSLFQYISPRKNERFGTSAKQSHSNIVLWLAIAICAIGAIVFSSGIMKTATIGEEMTMMAHSTPTELEGPQVTEPPIESDFEITVTEPVETTTTIVEYKTTQMCFIGDSRTVAMEQAVLTEVSFIAKSSMGLDWFNETASVKFAEIQENIGICVVALGVNDIHNVDKYIERLNAFAEEYPSKIFVYANIGPVNEEKYTGIPNTKIAEFNQAMADGLSDRWQILDQYSYLSAEGFSSNDGLHYAMQDSAKVFAWMVDSIKIQKITTTVT